MKKNLKNKLFLGTFFLLQIGYFLTALPEEAFPGVTYLPAYFLFSLSVVCITIELYFIVKELIQNARLNTELAVMRQQQELKEQQAAVYLKEITAKFQQERFHPCCNDGLLNAILANKRQIAQSHNIQVTYELFFPEESCIPVTDLSSIFFNLLDNGIEACIHFMDEASSQKNISFLRLTVNTNAGFLSIHMCNSKRPDMPFSRTSSKEDTLNHGFGLSIIEECAARNDGTCQWQDHGDHFDSLVLLRYKNG